ncbi:MAG: hypothetical protein ABJB93_11540 [Gaiellales bacterium]
MPAAYAVTTIDSVPIIADDGVDWRPIQHHFQLTAFGINVYRAAEPGIHLIGNHDELVGRHEEVYIVLSGSVEFLIDDESFTLQPGGLVVARDPAVRRSAVARSAGASVLAVGNREAPQFDSTWEPDHFQGFPTYQPPADERPAQAD